MKILLTDDHAVIRQGLKLILANHFKRAVFGEASNGRDALRLLAKEKWDVAVLDVTRPGRRGLEVLKEMRRRHPNTPVLILSMHPENHLVVRTLKAGASGYLTKESAGDELAEAIEKAMRGGRYICSSLAARMRSRRQVEVQRAAHERFSGRELLVMRMLASGNTVSQVARKLYLSVNTVSTCRARVLEKMHMKTYSELTWYAQQNKLV